MRTSLVLALLALSTPAFATPVFAASEASPVPVDPATWAAIRKVNPADYPSANTLLVTYSQSVVFQPDGQFTNTTHLLRLVLTPSGKADAASVGLDYAKDAEKMEVLGARVIKADGTVIPVDAARIQDTDQSGDANIYDPNGRSVKVTFEGLAIGDAVEYTSRLTRITPTRPGFFNDAFLFLSNEPMLEASYLVDGPALLPLTTEIYHPERGNPITATKQLSADRIHYGWTVHNAPQVVVENLMDFTAEVPELVVSTDPSWEHFSQWWAGVAAPQMVPTEGLKKKVAELTRNAKTDDQKIKALYDFVSSDIRYRGLGVGPRSGYTPRQADDTFTSRWGVCRDVAILLTTMLRAGGFTAYPVLTNVGDPVQTKIAYDGFNHAIVAMPGHDGVKWVFLDPTAKNNNELLPGNEHEQSALVCTPKGEPLGKTPAALPISNLGHATAKSVVGEDGTMTSSIRFETTGLFDMAVRSYAANTSPDQMRQGAEQVIHSSLPGAELTSFKISNPLELATPMTVDMEIRVPEAAVRTGNYQILSTLVTSGALGFVQKMLPQWMGALPSRKYGLDAQMAFQYDEDETVALPMGTKVLALPNPAHAANSVSSLDATCKEGKNGLECHRSFQLKSRFIDPAQYLQLRSVLGSLGQIARQPVILAGTGVN